MSKQLNDKNLAVLDCTSNFERYAHVESSLIYSSLEEPPYISIIIPTYRRADLLKEALDSAINQTNFTDYEIIVLDNDHLIDCATDALLKEYTETHRRIAYYRNSENIGLYGNWNRSIEISRTNWFCLLHDDDLLLPQYLFEIVSLLNNYSNEDIALWGNMSFFFENSKNLASSSKNNGNIEKEMFTKLIRNPFFLSPSDILRQVTLSATALVINQSYSMELGGFDERFYPPSDIAFFAKAAIYKKIATTPKFLSLRRLSVNTLRNTAVHESVFRVYYDLLKNIFVAQDLRNNMLVEISMVTLLYNLKKYNPNIDTNLLKEYHLHPFWTNCPNFILKILQAFFWLWAAKKTVKPHSK